MADSDPGKPDVDVLFVMGFRQSGTTLLSSLLGGVPGFLNLGEAHNVWGQRSRGWPKCGCGGSVDECEFWAPLVRTHSDGHSGVGDASAEPDREAMERAREAWVRAWRRSHLGWSLAAGQRVAADYSEVMEGIYRRAASDDDRILIDASKKPAYAALLEGMEGVSVHLVHVVRDPRACLWSRLRRQGREAPLNPNPMIVGRFAASWTAVNLLSERVSRANKHGTTSFLRYEDFVADPESVLRRVSETVGVSPISLPLQGPHTAIMPSGHTASGNARVRFKTGPIELRLDDAWRSSLPAGARSMVTALTYPLLVRYGYPVGSGRGSLV